VVATGNTWESLFLHCPEGQAISRIISLSWSDTNGTSSGDFPSLYNYRGTVDLCLGKSTCEVPVTSDTFPMYEIPEFLTITANCTTTFDLWVSPTGSSEANCTKEAPCNIPIALRRVRFLFFSEEGENRNFLIQSSESFYASVDGKQQDEKKQADSVHGPKKKIDAGATLKSSC
jgi:hypothetical protein